ncbi:MAG: hypothetical protein HOQ24_11965, partial [Mycobacteriaceae bacterium]|nr:hypothetical protein [Mycobacteriaceae bacterium]
MGRGILRHGGHRGRRAAAAAAAVLLTPLAGCGSDDGGRGVVLSFYTPADGAKASAASAARCTAEARGRYRIEQHTLPKNADDQRLQLARRLAGTDHTLDLM